MKRQAKLDGIARLVMTFIYIGLLQKFLGGME